MSLNQEVKPREFDIVAVSPLGATSIPNYRMFCTVNEAEYQRLVFFPEDAMLLMTGQGDAVYKYANESENPLLSPDTGYGRWVVGEQTMGELHWGWRQAQSDAEYLSKESGYKYVARPAKELFRYVLVQLPVPAGDPDPGGSIARPPVPTGDYPGEDVEKLRTSSFSRDRVLAYVAATLKVR